MLTSIITPVRAGTRSPFRHRAVLVVVVLTVLTLLSPSARAITIIDPATLDPRGNEGTCYGRGAPLIEWPCDTPALAPELPAQCGFGPTYNASGTSCVSFAFLPAYCSLPTEIWPDPCRGCGSFAVREGIPILLGPEQARSVL